MIVDPGGFEARQPHSAMARWEQEFAFNAEPHLRTGEFVEILGL